MFLISRSRVKDPETLAVAIELFNRVSRLIGLTYIFVPYGLDANKAASPSVGNMYIATDTTKLYICYVAGTWTNAGALYLPLAGGSMTGAIAMGTNKITGLAEGTASGDAVRYEQQDKTILFSVAGTLAVTVNASFEIPAPMALTISKVYINVKTAPTGASIIVDVNKSGTTIFTTQSARPEIAISGTADESGAPAVTALAANDILSIDIDQVGSTIAGEDLVVQVRCKVA